MMKTAYMTLLVIGVFVLVGCGTSEPEIADSNEDIIGTWRRVGGDTTFQDYCRWSRDGTNLCSTSDDLLVNTDDGLPDDYDDDYFEHWFEGTRYFDRPVEGTSSSGNFSNAPEECHEAGEYEIYIQASGNLKFVLIEDECRGRVDGMVGLGALEGEIEWERIP